MLTEIIKNYNLSGTAEEVLDALNAKTLKQTRDELISWAGVGEYLGFNTGIMISYTVNQAINNESLPVDARAGLDYANKLLNAGRMNFSLDEVQQSLENLRPIFSLLSIDTDALKSLGVWYVSILEKENETATLQQVESALSIINLEVVKTQLMEDGNTILAEYHSRINGYTGGLKPKLIIGTE